MDEILTASEFAEQSGIEKRYLTRWAANGEVPGAKLMGGGEKRGGMWVALRSAWEAAAAKERKPGPKPKTTAQPVTEPQEP